MKLYCSLQFIPYAYMSRETVHHKGLCCCLVIFIYIFLFPFLKNNFYFQYISLYAEITDVCVLVLILSVNNEPVTALQLSDIIRQLHSLLSERGPGNQPEEEHPALHPKPEEEA